MRSAFLLWIAQKSAPPRRSCHKVTDEVKAHGLMLPAACGHTALRGSVSRPYAAELTPPSRLRRASFPNQRRYTRSFFSQKNKSYNPHRNVNYSSFVMKPMPKNYSASASSNTKSSSLYLHTYFLPAETEESSIFSLSLSSIFD